jgi:hypothetical protein
MDYLGLHNTPKPAVHPEHLPTGPLEEEEEEEEAIAASFDRYRNYFSVRYSITYGREKRH